MKTLMAVCLMVVALTSYAEIYSFEKEVESILRNGESSFSHYQSHIIWTDIKVNDSFLVALLEDELDSFDSDQLESLAKQRADRICQWTGFEYAGSFVLQGNHQVFKFKNNWYQLDENAGNWPQLSDLRTVKIAPNAGHLSGSVVMAMLKINVDNDVTLRSSSPKSFSRISCSR